MPLYYQRNDIATMNVDVIVNTTNLHLTPGVGVSASIYRHAGEKQITQALAKYSHCLPGDIVMTDGFNLKAHTIIHTVGPKYVDGYQGEAAILAQCYQRSLVQAQVLNAKSIAFPLIASGTYQFPKELALQIATHTITAFLDHHEMDVYLVVYDKESFQISQQLYQNIESFVLDHDITMMSRVSNDQLFSLSEVTSSNLQAETITLKKQETFSAMVLRLIDQKGFTDVEVYKRANMDRKLFSKIRSDEQYQPKKNTAIALGIALKLSKRQLNQLLVKAGYALSDSILADRIVNYFLEEENYDIHTLNEALFYYTEKTL